MTVVACMCSSLAQVDRLNVVSGASVSGLLHLVDLAGSEKVKLTAASGQRLREAQNINKSVACLPACAYT